jgi:hypothetical protein
LVAGSIPVSRSSFRSDHERRLAGHLVFPTNGVRCSALAFRNGLNSIAADLSAEAPQARWPM